MRKLSSQVRIVHLNSAGQFFSHMKTTFLFLQLQQGSLQTKVCFRWSRETTGVFALESPEQLNN